MSKITRFIWIIRIIFPCFAREILSTGNTSKSKLQAMTINEKKKRIKNTGVVCDYVYLSGLKPGTPGPISSLSFLRTCLAVYEHIRMEHKQRDKI